MKKILIVAATELELQPFLTRLSADFTRQEPFLYSNENVFLQILITGVGAVATTFQLSRVLNSESFDAVLNVGICGCTNPDWQLGQLLNVVEDSFGDVGATDAKGKFTDVFDLGLANGNDAPFSKKKIAAQHKKMFQNLPQVQGISCNTVLGEGKTTKEFCAQYPNSVQTMEGAAFMYVCAMQQAPLYAQIRAISNYVEPRNKKNWKIEAATVALADYLLVWLKQLSPM